MQLIEEIQTEVLQLINRQEEGEHWDFKSQWHSSNSHLIKDIISLANSDADQNYRYLIIGVSDPVKGCEIVGVTDGEDRKNQAQLIDFLHSIEFAGHERPRVRIISFELDQKTIDTIVIYETTNKPFYLTKLPGSIKEKDLLNRIWVRQGDTNQLATKYDIAKMWKNHFGIDQPPLKRFKKLLGETNKWVRFDPGNYEISYHQDFPEFTINFGEIGEHEKSSDHLGHYFIDPTAYHDIVGLYYSSTLLFEIHYRMFDGFRVYLPSPESQHVNIEEFPWFLYIEKNSLKYDFYLLLGDDTSDRFGKTALPIIFFEDEFQRSRFVHYLETHIELLEEELKSKINAKKPKKFIGGEESKGSFECRVFELVAYEIFENWQYEGI